ncbi:MATE family efflux transporter [Psychromonas sp. Urea-02u-13]|uniref:MATE family efflux transporter n=1 Tax=Psychromonas sp. Urea-02u-13 TaxID=2058326 RepID=UPI000C3348AD|nr:MATE family efflux transporter [Psychromonas sp. Urea-02u-13]PKG38497.1 multidrug efflux protein [Psychromonas sp. Urea-02u-13]
MHTLNNTSLHSVKRTFWRYAIPSVVAMMVNGLYQIVDGMFVGHYIGYQGLAAINVSFPLLGLLMGLGLMIGLGAGSLLSIFRGEGKSEQAQKTLSSAFYLLLLFSLFASAFLLFLAQPLLIAQGASGDVFVLAEQYIHWFSYGAILTIAASALPMLVRNDSSPNVATLLMVFGALLNIILDYIFIAHFDWGLQGAAIATLISQAMVMMGSLVYFFSAQAQIKLNLSNFKFDINLAKQSITLGTSSLIIFLYFSFIMAVHNHLLMQYGNELHVAAFAIIGYIAALYYFFAEGLASGMQPPISYYFGAKQIPQIKLTLSFTLKITLYSGFATAIGIFLWPEQVIQLFIQEDLALQAITENGLRLHLFALALDGFLFVVAMFYVAINNSTKAIMISASNMLVQLPFLYFLPNWLGINGVWLSVPLSNVLLTVIIAPILYRDIKGLNGKTIEPLVHNPQLQLN